MKFYSKYILVMGVSIAMVTSCHKNLLNPVPQTSISDVTAFDQPYRVFNQVLGLYSALKQGHLYAGRLLTYGDSRGEEFLSEDPNLVTGADVWGMIPTNSATAVKGLWAAAYDCINKVNLFIDGMAAKGTSVVGASLSANYLGEARLIRALCYYELLQYYCRPYAEGSGSALGVPIRLIGIKGLGYSDLARSTVAETYTQILADLDFAEANLPSTYTTPALNTTRAHKNTAIGLKTRVYLSMQKYSNVITEANKIVPLVAPFKAATGVPDSLLADVTLLYKTPYNSTEAMFSVPFTTNSGDAPGTQNNLQLYYYNSSNGVGSIYSLNPAGIVSDASWTAADKRKTLIFTSTSSANLGKKYLTKYPTASPADNTPVLRYAEVMLNLAEAIARTTAGVDSRALALVNAIRKRSDAAVTLTATTNAELINLIMTERRIELLGEGFRSPDITRLLQTFPAKGSAPAKSPTQEGYIWPASQDEKSLNKLWVD